MNIRCPVVRGCLTQLKKKQEEAIHVIADELALDELMTRASIIISTPEYSQWRGFLIIEAMLHEIGVLYVIYRRSPGLVCADPIPSFDLSNKSWHGLTQMLTVLTDILNDVELTVAEARLGGAQILNEGSDAEVIKPYREDRMQGLYLKTARTITLCCTATIEAITTLRPFLMNDSTASVTKLAHEAVKVYEQRYGLGALPKLEELTRQLIEVRL